MGEAASAGPVRLIAGGWKMILFFNTNREEAEMVIRKKVKGVVEFNDGD